MAEAEVVRGLTPQASGTLLHWFNEAEQKAGAIISAIPLMDDEELQQTHDRADELERCSWMIRAAARTEILKRAARLRGGRGQQDKDEEGRVAIARKLAGQLNTHPRVILEDSSIFSTFFDTSRGATNSLDTYGTYDHLTEKEYYRAAMRTEDPHATLEYFAQQKAADPTYSTRDAWNYIKGLKTEPLDSPVPPLIENPTMKAWYDRFIGVIREAPNQPGLGRLLSNFVDDIRNYVQRPTGTRRTQILNLIRQEPPIDELDQIAQEIGVDRIHVAVWLNRLVEDDILERFEKELRKGARGQARTGYRIVRRVN